jgi:hypothetical protein
MNNVFVDNVTLGQLDYPFIANLIDCNLEVSSTLDTEFLKDNILFITLGSFFLDESLRTIEAKNIISAIENKALLITHQHKSLGKNSESFDLTSFKKFIREYNFKEENVYLLSQLKSDASNIYEYLPGVNFLATDRWLYDFYEHDIKHRRLKKHFYKHSDLAIPHKRFSMFWNRYEPKRLNIFCELISRQLLTDFNYTFSNGYDDSIERMISDIPDKFSEHYDEIVSWLSGVPYSAPMIEGSMDAHYTKIVYPYSLNFYMAKSDIHVVLETEPTGASFITEKTYKAIYHKKPLILVSQYNALESLRQEGFKTFSPYIDETYDTLQNFEDRINAILTELQRLQSLSESEMSQVLQGCKDIVDYNYEIINKKFVEKIPENFYFSRMLTF